MKRAGFSLIEVMIAVGLLSIVMAGFAAMMTINARTAHDDQLGRNWSDILYAVRGTLQNPALCSLALGGAPVGGPFTYHDPSGFLIGAGVLYNELQFNKVDVVTGAPIGPGQTFVTVYLQASKTGAHVRSPIYNQNIPGIKVNYSGAIITNCF